MRTAVTAGMFPVGALWGFRTAEELTANGARVLIEKPLDLLQAPLGLITAAKNLSHFKQGKYWRRNAVTILSFRTCPESNRQHWYSRIAGITALAVTLKLEAQF